METQNKTKKTIDYSKAKIYKIVCNTTGLTYIGSTIQKLCERLRGHRSKYKLYLQGKAGFITSFDIIKNNNYEIILIDECPCNNKEQLLKEERKYIEKMNCINKNIPTRTYEEWYENNKEKKKEYYQEWYQDNKDKIKEYHQEWYQDNKDKMKEYYKNNKKKILERHKEYHKDNKDKIKEYSKEYYKDNKDKILEQLKKTIQCEFCNSTIRVNNLRRHQLSLKCRKFQLSI